MNKLFSFFLLLALTTPSAYAEGSQAIDIPDASTTVSATGVVLVQFHTLYGMPLGVSESNTLIARPIYCMSNNPETKFVDWVAYRLDASSVLSDTKTSRKWKADPLLPENETLEPNDYDGAHATLHTDRGHQAPLASFKGTKYWQQTNYLSNITPQRSALNQGPWKRLEDKVRDIAATRTVYVMTGPLHERQMESLPGADESHRVPSGYWKIIAVQDFGQQPLTLAAFIFDQETERSENISSHRVTVDAVEARTGLDFFWQLPDEFESVIEKTISLNWLE